MNKMEYNGITLRTGRVLHFAYNGVHQPLQKVAREFLALLPPFDGLGDQLRRFLPLQTQAVLSETYLEIKLWWECVCRYPLLRGHGLPASTTNPSEQPM